jgi:hypothetical protein
MALVSAKFGGSRAADLGLRISGSDGIACSFFAHQKEQVKTPVKRKILSPYNPFIKKKK